MICVLSKIVVLVFPGDGCEYEYKIDAYGNETGEPLKITKAEGSTRTYLCKLCGATTDGSEEFSMRSHLGKQNQMLDPFAVQ